MVDIRRLTLPIANSELQDPADFEISANRVFPEIDEMGQQMNAVRDQIVSSVANVNTNVEALANLAWVSGATYSIGQVRYSLLDFLSYRRKTNGAGTVDPKNDYTNWAVLNESSAGGAELPISSTDITLTNLSSRLQVITMTAAGNRVNLPVATTLQNGAGVFTIKNVGKYRFHVAKSDTSFLCFVEPGQTVVLNLANAITSAGKWYVFGQNLQNIYDLNAPVQLLNGSSGTFDVVSLTATKLLFVYKKDSNSKLYARTINYGGTLGAETQIGTDSIYSSTNVSVDVLSSTQAIIVYKPSATVVRSVVVDIANDAITLGGTVDVDAATSSTYYQTKIVSVTATKAICYWITTASNVIYFRSITITGSTPALGSLVTTLLQASKFTVKKITSTKLLISYSYGANANVSLQLMSDTALTGTSFYAFGTYTGATSSNFSYCVINPNLGMFVNAASAYYEMIYLNLIDTSSLTPFVTKVIKLDINIVTSSITPSIALIDTNTMYLSWFNGANNDISGVVLQLTSDNSLRVGVISQGIETKINALSDSLLNIPIDATTVLQFARKSTPEIVYKTIRVADITDSNQIATTSASSILLSGGSGGGTNGIDGVDGKTAVVRYAQDANGTGFTDVSGTNPYIAIASLAPDHTPVVSDFSGLWWNRQSSSGSGGIIWSTNPPTTEGVAGDTLFDSSTSTLYGPRSSDPIDPWPPGIKLSGAAGDKGGFKYMLDSSTTTTVNPGLGKVRMNNTVYSKATLTQFAISSNTVLNQPLKDYMSIWTRDDRFIFLSNDNSSNEIAVFACIGVTSMDSGAWFKIDVEWIGGNTLVAGKYYTLMHDKVFGFDDLKTYNIARFNQNGDLIDKDDVVMSGIESGTYATMAAKTASLFDKEHFLVTDYGYKTNGVLYRCNGTSWIVADNGWLHDVFFVRRLISVGAAASAITNNGGKVQITATTHKLTSNVAVDTNEKVAVRIDGWSGTGAVAGNFDIISIDDANKFTIDLAYNASYGIPDLGLAGQDLLFTTQIKVPPLNEHSQITIECTPSISAGTGNKLTKFMLDGSVFAIAPETIATFRVGLRNKNSKTVQKTVIYEDMGGVSVLDSTSVYTLNKNTAQPTTLTIAVNCSTPNEYAGFERIRVKLEG